MQVVAAGNKEDASSFGHIFYGWVYSRFFPFCYSCLTASAVTMVGHFPTLWCLHLRQNENVPDKSCPQNLQHSTDFSTPLWCLLVFCILCNHGPGGLEFNLQAVPSGEVSVHYFVFSEEGHAPRDLRTHLQQPPHREHLRKDTREQNLDQLDPTSGETRLRRPRKMRVSEALQALLLCDVL